MLLFLFVLTFISYIVSTPTTQSIELRIVGGDDIDITRAPYQVFYRVGDRECGGVIIAEDIILTAAHCVQGTRPEMFQVRAGSSYAETGGQIYPVGDLLWHPGYNVNAFFDCDIAVLWLPRPLAFSVSVAPIQMMSANEEIRDGELTVVTGYGQLSEDGVLPTMLQNVMVPKINDKQCYAAFQPYYSITPNMICAGFVEGGKDACLGDSGGPMVYNNKLAGIVSWGIGCARPGVPGIYTKISALKPWIDNSIAQLRGKHSSSYLLGSFSST